MESQIQTQYTGMSNKKLYTCFPTYIWNISCQLNYFYFYIFVLNEYNSPALFMDESRQS